MLQVPNVRNSARIARTSDVASSRTWAATSTGVALGKHVTGRRLIAGAGGDPRRQGDVEEAVMLEQRAVVAMPDGVVESGRAFERLPFGGAQQDGVRELVLGLERVERRAAGPKLDADAARGDGVHRVLVRATTGISR